MIVDYKHLYETAVVNPAKLPELKVVANRIRTGRPRYEQVAKDLDNGIPWWFIGITHFMEAGAFKHPFDFHLHCGDPLTARTVHVPKGRPLDNPHKGTEQPSVTNPYTWEESALDALTFMSYDKLTGWDLVMCLYLFEKYNGQGYNKRGLLSPYLWSYTNYYTKGKFVTDGNYDPEVISKQPGVVAIMKVLLGDTLGHKVGNGVV